MATPRTSKLQGNGTFTIPSDIRRELDLRKGDIVIFEETDDGILMTPLRQLAQTDPDEAWAIIEEYQLSPAEIAERSDKQAGPAT